MPASRQTGKVSIAFHESEYPEIRGVWNCFKNLEQGIDEVAHDSRASEPLIKPSENEREGYVHNVVYSCGSLLHGRHLIIPYGVSDYATTFARLSLDELLAAMN